MTTVNNQYDVIVVGAGCAGPAAAKKASELGLKTLLIEKAKHPGHKNVSGTCLNTTALSDPDLQYLIEGPVEREIREMRTYQISNERTTVFHEYPTNGGLLLLSIRRDEFDNWHVQQAKKAGSDLLLSTSVVNIIEENGYIKGVVTDSGKSYYGKVIIDSAGVNSIVGRKAGLIPKRTGSDMILYVTVNVHLGKDKIDDRFGDCIEYYHAPGCQYKVWPWIFPKKDVVTLGTGGYMSPEMINNATPSVNTYMQNFLNLPIVEKKLKGGEIVAWGVHLEFDEKIKENVRDGLILTGEAGGFVMPFLGEGMPEAFFTGIYAANAAAEGIKSGDVSKEKLKSHFNEQVESNIFMQAFNYVASENKKSIISRTDDEITDIMQAICFGGGFISNVIHTNWIKGAETENIELVKDAYNFMEFVKPYKTFGSNFEEIYNQRRKK